MNEIRCHTLLQLVAVSPSKHSECVHTLLPRALSIPMSLHITHYSMCEECGGTSNAIVPFSLQDSVVRKLTSSSSSSRATFCARHCYSRRQLKWKQSILTLALAKPIYNVEENLKSHEFIYVDLQCITNPCWKNVLKIATPKPRLWISAITNCYYYYLFVFIEHDV